MIGVGCCPSRTGKVRTWLLGHPANTYEKKGLGASSAYAHVAEQNHGLPKGLSGWTYTYTL